MSVHEGKAHTYNVYGEELAKKLNNNIKKRTSKNTNKKHQSKKRDIKNTNKKYKKARHTPVHPLPIPGVVIHVFVELFVEHVQR